MNFPLPNFVTGIATNAGESAFPRLWEGLVLCIAPSIGIQGAKLYDYSGKGHHGVLTNFALSGATSNYIPSGKFGYAINFDGSNDYINCGTVPEIDDASKNLSLMFWIRSSATSAQTVITYDNNSVLQPNADWYCYINGSNALRIGGFGSTGELDTGITGLRDGKWHQVVIILKQTTLEVYADGIIRYNPANTKSHANFSSSFILQIGAAENVAAYNGDVGDVMVWNRELMSDEVRLLYVGASPLMLSYTPNYTGTSLVSDTVLPSLINLSAAILSPTIVAEGNQIVTPSVLNLTATLQTPTILTGNIDSFTKLLVHGNGTDGSTSFIDSSPLGLTLTPNDSAQIDTAQSKFGGASILLDSTGSQDYVQSADHADLDLGTLDFAIDCWVRFPSTPGGNVTIFGRTTDGSSYMYWSLEGGNWRFRDYNSGNVIDFSRTMSMSANTWYHVAVTRNGSNFRMFLDGVQQGATYTSAASITARAVGYDIGSMTQNSGYQMNGWIDEFRLSVGDSRWTSDFTPPTTEYGDESVSVTVTPSAIDLLSTIQTPTINLDAIVSPSVLNILSDILSPLAGNVVSFTPSVLDISSSVENITIKIDAAVTPSTLSLIGNLLSPLIPEDSIFIASVLNLASTTNNPSIEIAVTYSAYAQKIVSYNPLIFVTNTSPARLVKVDVTIPSSPTWGAYELVGINSVKDVFVNETTGYVYAVGANGMVVKAPLSNLSTQTLIDLSDTDNITTIVGLADTGFTYVGTNNALGELYQLDERSAFEIDTDLQVIAPISFELDTDFNIVAVFEIPTECYGLGSNTFNIDTDFKCLTDVLDSITPINFQDVHVYIDNVELAGNDLNYTSVEIVHTIDEESRATFTLTRRHDELNKTLDGNTVIITNQNAVKIIINGNIEFDGFISDLNATYDLSSDLVSVAALMQQPSTQYNNVTLSLPGLNSRLSLYDILVQNPSISNPIVDPNNETNPKKYKGVRVNLGIKTTEKVSRFYDFDGTGSVADKITKGTFNPLQNWTYFWSPTVKKFGEFTLGQTSAIVFNYIGTSLSPVSNDLWSLQYAKARRQREYPNEQILLGTGSVVASNFDSVVIVPSATIFSALVSAGYINGGGVIQTKFNKVLDYKSLKLNFSSKVLQQIYSIMTSKLGYTVGSAPFQNVSTGASGQYIPQIHWKDEPNGLYAVTPASYNYIDFCKKIADLEYKKLLNISGNILPDTSASFTLTLDAYYYYKLKLLTRINVDNTTTSNIYNNNNGFPLSIKSITINTNSMKVNIQASNSKSKEELDVLNGQFPDETDSQYYQEEKTTLIAQKSDMRTRLTVT